MLVTETEPVKAEEPEVAKNTLLASLLVLLVVKLLALTLMPEDKLAPFVARTVTLRVGVSNWVWPSALKVDCKLLRLTLPVVPRVELGAVALMLPVLLLSP